MRARFLLFAVCVMAAALAVVAPVAQAQPGLYPAGGGTGSTFDSSFVYQYVDANDIWEYRATTLWPQKGNFDSTKIKITYDGASPALVILAGTGGGILDVGNNVYGGKMRFGDDANSIIFGNSAITIYSALSNGVRLQSSYNKFMLGLTNTLGDTNQTVIGTANAILAGAYGSTIAGGSCNMLPSGPYGFIGGGERNTFSGNGGWNVMVGGLLNTSGYRYSFSGGGYNNQQEAGVEVGTLVGGQGNSIAGTADYGALVGGVGNRITGLYTFLGGGRNNLASGDTSAVLYGGYNRATGASSMAGGTSSLASGAQSVALGLNNTASGTYSNAFGYANVASGLGSMGIGSANSVSGSFAGAIGSANVTSGTLGFAVGGQARASLYGSFSHAAGVFGSAAGQAQAMELILRDTTSNAVPDTLTLDGADVVGNLYAVLDTGTVWKFTVEISARTQGGSGAGYEFHGVIKNIAGVVTFIGSPSVDIWEDVSAWDCTVVADDGNDALGVIVTGAEGAIIRWVATMRLTQVKW